jgi:hypothetical protein
MVDMRNSVIEFLHATGQGDLSRALTIERLTFVKRIEELERWKAEATAVIRLLRSIRCSPDDDEVPSDLLSRELALVGDDPNDEEASDG